MLGRGGDDWCRGITGRAGRGATTETGAEPVEPFFFMGASAARLMGAKAARHAVSFISSQRMCPIAPDELDAPVSGRVSFSFTPPRRAASAARRALIASFLGADFLSLKFSVLVFCSFDPWI